MTSKRNSKPMTRKEENQAIRDAVQAAVRAERKKGTFNVSGRGHEPRISLSGQLATILRGVDIPGMYVSGFGSHSLYARRVFKTAREIFRERFRWDAIAVGDHSAYRKENPARSRPAMVSKFARRIRR